MWCIHADYAPGRNFDGRTVENEIEVADAHPPGARSFRQDDYIRKFRELSGLYADSAEQGPMSPFFWPPMMFLKGRPLAEVDAPFRAAPHA